MGRRTEIPHEEMQPPVRCDDESTWRHKGESIDLPRLLQLIEEGGPWGLDLRGCDMERIDARPEALRPYVEAYAQKHGPALTPPWLMPGAAGIGSINLCEANLANARLGDAHLEHAAADGAHLEHAYLSHAHLENANLLDAHLEHAYLVSARLENASLSDAHLEHADLAWAYLEDADLSDAHLEHADLSDAHLENANLSDAHLEHTNLSDAHLEHASLAEAHLENANLRRAHLESANLVGARLHGAFLYDARLDRTRIRRESLGKAIGDEVGTRDWTAVGSQFHDAREAYLALKTNFDSIGRYDDASWAYVKEQQMEKAMHFPTSPGQWWLRGCMRGTVPPPWWGPRRLPRWLWWKLRSAFYNSRLFLGLCPPGTRQLMARRTEGGEQPVDWVSRWRWARNWAFELLAGYGERVYMPVVWAVVVVLLFALIYAAAGNIASGDVGALQGQPTHSPITALVHSISAFATIGFNTLEPQGWGARLLTAIEAMFGIGLFALFVFTLGNRMRRS